MSPQSQKGKPYEKDLPSLKNDITNNLEPQKPVIYSRYLQLGFVTAYWKNHSFSNQSKSCYINYVSQLAFFYSLMISENKAGSLGHHYWAVLGCGL